MLHWFLLLTTTYIIFSAIFLFIHAYNFICNYMNKNSYTNSKVDSAKINSFIVFVMLINYEWDGFLVVPLNLADLISCLRKETRNKYFIISFRISRMVDIEILIFEVCNCKPLWHITSKSCHNRDISRKLWREIVDELNRNNKYFLIKHRCLFHYIGNQPLPLR